MFNTCCIESCGSRRKNVKLHKFPTSAIGLHKWLRCINSDNLNRLSVKKLCKLYVCHKHFEVRFVNSKTSRLQQNAYPTLFTKDEITTGVPLRVYEDSQYVNPSFDHSYIQMRKHMDHTYFQSMDSNSQIHLSILERVQMPMIPSTTEIFGMREVDTRQILREERGLEISEADLNEVKTEETLQMMTDEEIFEEVKEEEGLTEILEPPTTTAKIKPDTAFNCINTCITWAEENGVSAKDVIVLRNLREKVFKQKLQVAKKNRP